MFVWYHHHHHHHHCFNQEISERGSNESKGMCYFKYFLYCKVITFKLPFLASGRKLHPPQSTVGYLCLSLEYFYMEEDLSHQN